MSLSFRVLGDVGRDNALIVTVDTGQTISRLLFDCGEGCVSELPFADVSAIDHLFFSHLHMDHVGGFDSFFRCVYNRDTKPNHIWGPPQTAAIIQHRFQGFQWNLVAGARVSWHVHDLAESTVTSWRFELAEGFAQAHDAGRRATDGAIVTEPAYRVESLTMNHGTPSMAYIVREADRLNVNTGRMAELGLRPGPWLQKVKEPSADLASKVQIGDQEWTIGDLQQRLLTRTPGESVAYLTDFLLDDSAMTRLGQALQGVGTVICECQYADADAPLAIRNYHMTTTQVATLAARAGVGRLVLFHLSDRYRPEQWRAMLGEAQAIFAGTVFPEQWKLG
jgi:ribonuclease Z